MFKSSKKCLHLRNLVVCIQLILLVINVAIYTQSQSIYIGKTSKLANLNHWINGNRYSMSCVVPWFDVNQQSYCYFCMTRTFLMRMSTISRLVFSWTSSCSQRKFSSSKSINVYRRFIGCWKISSVLTKKF